MMFGSSGRLFSLKEVAREARCSVGAARQWLTRLGIPLIEMPGGEAVHLMGLEVGVALAGLPQRVKELLMRDPEFLVDTLFQVCGR